MTRRPSGSTLPFTGWPRDYGWSRYCSTHSCRPRRSACWPRSGARTARLTGRASVRSRAARRWASSDSCSRGLSRLRPTPPRAGRVVDTHCHLDACEPPDGELVSRAREAGVRRIATVGTDPESVARALAAADAHDEGYAIVGRHPHGAAGFDPAALDAIERAAAHPRVRAIGETGLDYYRDLSPREDQRRAFEAQLELAGRLGLPVVIHTRAAEDDTFALLREHADRVTVVLHCFSAPDRLDECVERRYICSFAGNVTFPKAPELAAAAKQVPDELLLVETDSPYLAPQPVRGKPNEPAHVTHTARFVAELRRVAYEELERTVEANAARVLRW